MMAVNGFHHNINDDILTIMMKKIIRPKMNKNCNDSQTADEKRVHDL